MYRESEINGVIQVLGVFALMHKPAFLIAQDKHKCTRIFSVFRASTNTTAATNTTSGDNSRHNSVSNVEAAPTPLPTRSNAAATSDTSTHDDGRPPDYQEALAYRKTEKQEAEGYPEPSLVDGLQPPSYDAVYQ